MNNSGTSVIRNAAYLGLGLLSSAAALAVSRSRRRRDWNRGKVVVITGASRGLGLALAEEFGRRGARLVLGARDAAELNRARRILADSGAVIDEGNLLTVSADLRKPEEAQGLVDQAIAHFGHVDVLINNAESSRLDPLRISRSRGSTR
jgi:NAD(P)-dependent dehydrogenase (short-subunit alcohol dehydrogenase family)